MDKSWITNDAREREAYENELNGFIAFVFGLSTVGNNILCPCPKDGNDEHASRDDDDQMFCAKMQGVNTSKPAGQIATTPVTNDVPLVGEDVVLYAIVRSDLPVAKGIIISTKPDTTVGGEPLGRQYCELVVTCVLKRDAILPRPYGNMETMTNAHLKTIAWPYKKLKIMNKSSASGYAWSQR